MGRLRVLDPAGEPEPYDEGYFVGGGARAGYPDYEADERWHRRTANERLDRVERWVRPGTGRRLVDVGTATGFLPEEARYRGFEVAGVEISQWAARHARARGVRVEPSLSALEDLAGTLDVVTMFQVLEHIPDPGEALTQAFGLLRPGGVVVCETWDLDSATARRAGQVWQQMQPPSVLWLFTPASAAQMVERAGLQPVSWQRTPKTVSLATVGGQALALGGRRVERLLTPLTSRVGLPYPLDDLVTFVARKPRA